MNIKSIIRSIWIASALLRDPGSIKFAHLWIPPLLPSQFPLSDKVPWITYKAIAWLKSYFKPNMFVFEYGSGHSTIFISRRVYKLISVEHDRAWHSRVSSMLSKEAISNCEYILCEPEYKISAEVASYGYNSYTSAVTEFAGMSFEKYVKIIDKYPDESFDLVIVDGYARASCIAHAITKIRHGGYLLLDNSEEEKYNSVKSLLACYKRTDFFGAGPYLSFLWQTSVWEIKFVDSFNSLH